jgi:hypothetical protein
MRLPSDRVLRWILAGELAGIAALALWWTVRGWR